MNLETVALFAITEFVLSLTPGPAVLLVLGLSMRHGFGIGFMATLGIISTNALFFTLSALGVGAAILASATLFTILKWLGALYLVYLGLGMITPLFQRIRKKQPDHKGLDLAGVKRSAPKSRHLELRSFWQGFSLQASNPKNLAFFVAILPQFIDPAGELPLQMVVLGTVSVLLELPILIFYGFAFATSARLMTRSVIEWIEAIGGGILITLGSALAFSQRD